MAKRIFDIVGAIAGLVFVSPVLLLIAVMIYFKMGRPILYRQVRPGLHSRPFTIYKFRTMFELKNNKGDLLPDQERLTRFGRFLRSTSLDELPELWNVVRGDMSLVGPRPLLMHYLPLYTCEQARRHEVKPGITGWAQIHGRNAVDWEERFRLDVWYVDHRSFWLDLKTLAVTGLKILRREGISADGHATMPEFTGASSISNSDE